jgi:NAD(P)-dependent dehydrogenase (short-subunit alcohol dehydrogenase family)
LVSSRKRRDNLCLVEKEALLDFKGRTALVTGSTRGIGLACARAFALRGARVVISSRKIDACEEVAAALRDEGLDAIPIAAHAGRDDDLQRLVEGTVREYGALDVVVANAGLNPTFAPLAELGEESWAKVLDANLSGTWRLACHCLPLMRPEGAFIAISSVTARFGMPGSSVYGVSKAAIEQLVRQLAVEWGPRGIRVNAVSPGTIDTDMIRALAGRPGFLDQIVASTPLGRIGQAEDVAGVVAFLAGDLARHVTGQVVIVDGGQTIMRGQYF